MKSILFSVALLSSTYLFAQTVDVVAEDPNSNAMTGDLNSNTQNTNSTVNSNNNSQQDSRTTNNYGAGAGSAQPVMSAVAPSLMSTGQDTCLMSTSGGLQLIDLGLSAGSYKQDEECNRRRDAKLLSDLGMKVPAISRMCQNLDNWKAMLAAGSPCPIIVGGKMVFGKNAILIMKNRPEVYIPDYSEKTLFGFYKNRKFYNQILGIGDTNEKPENEETGPQLSVSERFRTSSSGD